MTKSEQIRMIHKVLFVKEDVDDPNKPEITVDMFNTCVSNCIIRFSGVEMDTSLQNKIIETLRGLKSLSSQVSHAEVKSAVLGLINDIRKNE